MYSKKSIFISHTKNEETFRDIEIEKRELYYLKYPVNIETVNSQICVDVDEIITSNQAFFFPRVRGYTKNFNKTKYMHFLLKSEKASKNL